MFKAEEKHLIFWKRNKLTKGTRKSTDLSSGANSSNKVSLAVPVLDPPGFIEELQQKQSFHNRPNYIEQMWENNESDFDENKNPNVGNEILIERFYNSK